jgi:alpha-L-rhamnosidase
MRTLRCTRIALLVVMIVNATAISSGQNMITPLRLTCEFRTDPLGIDTRQPRLTWVLESTDRGAWQTACRILVSSKMALLAAGTGDLWDSGKIPGDRTTSVRYEGRPLASHQMCFWKVMAWDGDTPGPWSKPAFWSMGILTPGEWHAGWIGYDAPRRDEQPAAFATAQWIWHAADKPWKAPAGKRFFVRVLEIGKEVTSAGLAVTADDRFTLFINGKKVASSPSGPGAWKTPQRPEVASLLVTGKNIFYVEAENASPGPAGLMFWLRLMHKNGTVETLVSDRSWFSSDIPHAHWQTEGPGTGEGKAAEALGIIGMPPWGVLDGSMLILPPPRHLGTAFTVAKPVGRAVLYATALGLCDVYLNGSRVSDDYFTPGWTDYAKRVYYRAYDVTKLLRKGVNTWGGILADGWFSGHVGWGLQRDHYGTKTRFRAQLRIEYADGSTEDLGTGPGWKAWTGPTLEADFLMGETFDARLAGGSFPDEVLGEPVDVGAGVQPLLEAHPGQAVCAFAELSPKSHRLVAPDTWVFDLAQNFAGVVRLRVRGTRGQRITLRFGERLNPDGTLYTDNLRSARAIDTYICSGNGEEIWQPRFTFHGFQYVEVSGLREPADASTITGIALSSDTPSAGAFECSDPMVNKLYSNIVWTQRANFIDIPTDCPQRDERLGWTGDAHVYIRSACLNADVQAFFHKWIVDLTDAQRADGQFPMVAPLKVADGDGGPAWADAGVICPWTIYEVYGDRDILEQHFPSMVKFVEFCKGRSTPGLLPPAKFHCFGDWLNIEAETPHDVIFITYFARCTRLLSQAAGVLGKMDESEKYRLLFEQIKGVFVSTYVDSDGRIKGNTQTAYVLALASGLLEGEAAKRAARHLVADIESRGWRLSTGFVGTKDLMLVLSAVGRNDVAYRLLQNEVFPSWGFTIRQGATSIWERWDGWTPEKGFQDPGMNSFAHYAFGAVYQWMVESIGGIRSDGPGFRKLVIAPQPGGTLTWARVGYESVAGSISTAWKITDGRMTLNVAIPANTRATIHLPGVGGEVLESGAPVARGRGLTMMKQGVFEAVSGTYEFVYPYSGHVDGR